MCIRQSRQAFINSVRHPDRADGDVESREGYVASLQLMLFGCIRASEWTELKKRPATSSRDERTHRGWGEGKGKERKKRYRENNRSLSAGDLYSERKSEGERGRKHLSALSSKTLAAIKYMALDCAL